MNASNSFEVTTTGSIAHDLMELFQSGELDRVEELTPDSSSALSNRPVGVEPIVTLIITFVVQVGVTVTAEIVKEYLVKKLKKEDPRDKLEVKNRKSDDSV